MLNVNFFPYRPILLAWGSKILLRHYHTQGTTVAVEAIKRCEEFSSACHLDEARHKLGKALGEVAKQKLDTIPATLSPGRQRAIRR